LISEKHRYKYVLFRLGTLSVALVDRNRTDWLWELSGRQKTETCIPRILYCIPREDETCIATEGDCALEDFDFLSSNRKNIVTSVAVSAGSSAFGWLVF
jgi:hypothetical protein